MAVVIINPNSTVTMTDAMVRQARRSAPELQFEGWTSHQGPPAIQGAADGALATPPLLALVKRASKAGADGIVIGCFDDTALQEASSLADCPVVGIGQASYHYAALRSRTFSVVTTLSVSVPVIQGNIERQGLGQLVARVRASEIPVLELEAQPEQAGQMIVTEAIRAEADDDISAVILGCAGMTEVADTVRTALTIELIDPVECTAKCMRWLVQTP